LKLTILGAGSGLPHPDFNHSALVVQTEVGNFLADCGEGTARQLLRHKFNGDFLDAILISHYHPDHVSGIYMVLQMLYLEGRTKPLKLFLPERPAAFLETIHMFYIFEQRFPFALILHELSDLELIFSNVSALPTDHLTNYADVVRQQQYPNLMQSFSLVFRDNGKVLVYTSDCNTFNNIKLIMDTADLVIMDGLHPEAGLIISFINSYKKQLILTHGLSEAMEAWLKANPDPRIELARDNDTQTL
jgi:ribonuclease Z